MRRRWIEGMIDEDVLIKRWLFERYGSTHCVGRREEKKGRRMKD